MASFQIVINRAGLGMQMNDRELIQHLQGLGSNLLCQENQIKHRGKFQRVENIKQASTRTGNWRMKANGTRGVGTSGVSRAAAGCS